jgi:hypothetical protein
MLLSICIGISISIIKSNMKSTYNKFILKIIIWFSTNYSDNVNMSNLIDRISNTNYLVNNYRIIKDNDFIGKNYLYIMYFRMEYGIVGNTREITNK